MLRQPLDGHYAEYGHRQRTGDMRENKDSGPVILFPQDERHGFGGKGRECGQSAKKPGNGEQPRFRRQYDIAMKILQRDADEEAADEVCRKSAQGQGGEYGI